MQSAQSEEIRGFSSRSLLSNLLLILVSAGLVVWSLNLVKTRFTSVISRDAVINGVVIDLKTPSQGVVSGLSLKTGEAIISGQKITTLKNERVSNLEVQVITSKLKEQQVELERNKAKLNGLKNQLQLAKQEQKNQSRLVIQQAQYSTQEVLNELKAEQARYNLTKVNYERTEYLVKEGALPIFHNCQSCTSKFKR